MTSFSTDEIIEATGGELIGGPHDMLFKSICIDSRTIEEGELFWAIRGETFDGNDFKDEAFKRGALGIVTDDRVMADDMAEGVAFIRVETSLKALQDMAAYNRKKFPVPLVAITGSNGKTSTKEILASILSSKYEVLKNDGNLNNQIGAPLTLLKIHSGHEIAVVEMGMNKAGEIRNLAQMARPDFGVITNIGEAHLEGLGSIENVRKAKGELIETLGNESTAILNADDDAFKELSAFARGKIVSFGIANSADVNASEIEIEWGKGTLFMLSAKGETIPVLLPLYGTHQLYNALAASAAASSLGFNLVEIREGLEKYGAFSGRMEILSEGGINLINDCYNANPPSLRYAMDTMKELAKGRKIAVLGDMLELGKDEERIHRELGRYAIYCDIDILLTLGPRAEKIAEGALKSGMKSEQASSFDDKNALINHLLSEVREGDWVLVKGSRAMKMEEISSALLQELKNRKEAG